MASRPFAPAIFKKEGYELMARQKYATQGNTETKIVNAIDDLREFHKFREEILPQLRKALLRGDDADTIYKNFQAYAAARAVSIAAQEVDSGKALAAIKDILDRTQGRAKERSEVTHKLSSLPEEQLDAILLSKLKGTNTEENDDDKDTKH